MADKMAWLRGVGFGAALLSSVTGLTGAICITDGYQYVEGDKPNSIPDGAFWHTPEFCQKNCEALWWCDKWTWKQDGRHDLLIGPGGCWTYSSNATLEKINASVTSGRVASGPKRCEDANTTLLPTLIPLPTLWPADDALGEAPTEAIVNDTNLTNLTLPTAEGKSSGGSFQWWMFALVAGVLGICIVLMYVFGGEKVKSKSKKKKSSRSAKMPRKSESDRLAEAEEAAPLVQEQPQSVPPAAAPAAPAQLPAASAAPVATVSQGRPVATQYAQFQPGVFQMATMSAYTQAGARQPQFAPAV